MGGNVESVTGGVRDRRREGSGWGRLAKREGKNVLGRK